MSAVCIYAPAYLFLELWAGSFPHHSISLNIVIFTTLVFKFQCSSYFTCYYLSDDNLGVLQRNLNILNYFNPVWRCLFSKDTDGMDLMLGNKIFSHF